MLTFETALLSWNNCVKLQDIINNITLKVWQKFAWLNYLSSRLQVFFKKDVLRNFKKFTGELQKPAILSKKITTATGIFYQFGKFQSHLFI